MERAVALRKLGKLLGKSLCYRINEKAPTPEDRDIARAELPEARAERNRLKELKEARYEAILKADAEYQTLKAAYTAARDRAEHLEGTTRYYKISVGTSNGMFFVVKAEGDSWEDVLDKLTQKEAA